MVNIILVDNKDIEIGQKEKMQAHIDGDLHRALSVQMYNSKGEILIHKRASSKYHCGGMWTNACCSHPFPGELTIDAANRRLFEELGYKQIDLTEKYMFHYKESFENGLIEHEIDHVFIGNTNFDPPDINSEEIENSQWRPANELNIIDSIVFLGFCQNLNEKLKKSSIFVLSSRYEGFPMVLIEAMSQGCACVSFDCVSGPKEIIKDGIDGILVEDQNMLQMEKEICRLIEDDKLRKLLAENAVRNIQRLSIQNISDKWLDLVNNIIDKG